MSKLFKTLSIGAAIGTLAYVVFKYKSDQKFKEKVDEKTEEVKEKVIDKACTFTVNHPKAALGIITGTVVGGAVLGTLSVVKGVNACSKNFAMVTKTPVMTEEECRQMNIWSKENGYDDRLEAVENFAKNMSLYDNEVFSFSQYDDEEGARKTCVYQGCKKDGMNYERVEYV